MAVSPRRVTTVRQLEIMIDFMDSHRELAMARIRSKEGRVHKDRMWRELESRLNIAGPARSGPEWNKVWNELKHKVKCKGIKIKAAQRGLGGGPPPPELTPLETRVLNIIGNDVDPLEGVRQEQFHQDSIPESFLKVTYDDEPKQPWPVLHLSPNLGGQHTEEGGDNGNKWILPMQSQHLHMENSDMDGTESHDTHHIPNSEMDSVESEEDIKPSFPILLSPNPSGLHPEEVADNDTKWTPMQSQHQPNMQNHEMNGDELEAEGSSDVEEEAEPQNARQVHPETSSISQPRRPPFVRGRGACSRGAPPTQSKVQPTRSTIRARQRHIDESKATMARIEELRASTDARYAEVIALQHETAARQIVAAERQAAAAERQAAAAERRADAQIAYAQSWESIARSLRAVAEVVNEYRRGSFRQRQGNHTNRE